MPDRVFPILGTSIPPLLGRDAIMQRMLGALTKPMPDHLQVVGSRFAGKTVILHELANQLRDSGAPYTAVMLWDLGHQTPSTDELFMQRFASELSDALAQNHADYAEHLKLVEGNPYKDISEVLEILNQEGVKLLAIMDGFDKPLCNGQLTRNLWDQLRELALKPCLRLVTASRRTLRDLIRHPDAQTSDFWNIFDPTPVRVGCFNEHDLITALAHLPTVRLTKGAETELWNATNGFPVMVLDVLNALVTEGLTGEASSETINKACDSAFPSLRDKIDSLWSDCSPTCQDLLQRVLEEGVVVRAGIAHADVDTLIERGFVHQTGNKLQRPNRLLAQYLREQPNEGNALARLFGTAETHQKNFKSALERRISQIIGLDATLKRYLERGAEDLPDHPDVFLTNVRGIVNQGFELIWRAELEGRAIPSGWISTWNYNQERGVGDWQTSFPQGVHRVRLLNLMTGTDRSGSCAKYVTKSTFALMSSAHVFGDFGQHQEGAAIDAGTAYAALHICIELAAVIARELPTLR